MKQALWIAGLILTGLVTTGAQLDRQSRVTASLAETVPPFMRGFAQERIAREALGKGDPELALVEARRLVTLRPLPAEHLRTLALAEALVGNREQSLATLQTAARRGWRDPIIQETMLRLAIEKGDSGEAARRYAALTAKPQTPAALLEELGPPALGTNTSRKQFAAILAPAKRWHSVFLSRGVQALPAEASAEIILTASDQGADFDCRRLRGAQRAIARKRGGTEESIARLIEDNCSKDQL